MPSMSSISAAWDTLLWELWGYAGFSWTAHSPRGDSTLLPVRLGRSHGSKVLPRVR